MTEKFILRTYCHLIKPIISELIAIKTLIDNRDVGDIVAIPVEEWIRAKPQTIKLNIIFFSTQTPPYTARPGFRLIRAVYNVPDLDPTKADWATIKKACGGATGYSWGRFRATANLNNGRQMQVYGGTAADAETRIKALLELSTANFLTITVAEEKQQGLRDKDQKLYKPTIQVYPAYFSIVNSKKIVTESNKQNTSSTVGTLSGNYKRKNTTKIPLWVTKEPSNAKALIKAAFTIT